MTKQTCVACLKQFAECDCLDLPEKDGWGFYYYYNRHVENLARWARAFGLLMIALCVISEAKAAPVCAEKQDAYKLALADMQGTGEKLWNELVAEGKCANVPARYLWTMDTYKQPEFTRVATYLAFGRHVYGLTTTLPSGLWLIDDHQHPPQDMALHEKFYSTWNVPNNGNERVASCCNLKDCYPSTTKKVGEHWYAQRREDFQWILIPEGKLEHNQPDPRESPDYQSHVCMTPPGSGKTVYCAVLGSGI